MLVVVIVELSSDDDENSSVALDGGLLTDVVIASIFVLMGSLVVRSNSMLLMADTLVWCSVSMAVVEVN